jgi:hypothetical protein
VEIKATVLGMFLLDAHTVMIMHGRLIQPHSPNDTLQHTFKEMHKHRHVQNPRTLDLGTAYCTVVLSYTICFILSIVAYFYQKTNSESIADSAHDIYHTDKSTVKGSFVAFKRRTVLYHIYVSGSFDLQRLRID